MSKENFKIFVKSNPNLANYVRNNEMTWQKFYEMYDLYGEEHEIWNNYLNNNNTSNTNVMDNFKGFFDLLKGIDLKTVQKTLTGLDKAIGTFREFSNNDSNNNFNNYESRPTDRYYED